MNLFTKLTAAALLAGATLTAVAQDNTGLGKATISDPLPTEPQTFLQAVYLGWTLNGSYLEIIEVADTDLTVLVTFGGKTYELEWGDYDTYFDNMLPTNPDAVYDNPLQGNLLTISFAEKAFQAGYPVGDYVVEIPAGLVKNTDGLYNEAQTITYRKVDPVAPTSINPCEPLPNGQMGGMLPEINSVTFTFEEPVTVNRSVVPSLVRRDVFEAQPYYVEKYTIGDDGKSISLDLTGKLDRGVWYYLEVPEGYVSVGENYVNARVYLEYMYWDGMDQAIVVSAPDRLSSMFDVKPFILTWDYQPIHFPANAPDTDFQIGFPDQGWHDGDRIMIPSSWYELINIDREGNEYAVSETTPANAVRLDVAELTEDWIGYRFEITFPAGLVENEAGLDNPPLTRSFEVWNTWPDYEITADAGVITVDFLYSDWVTWSLDEGVTLTNDDTDTTYKLRYNYGHFGGATGEVGITNDGPVHNLYVELFDLDLPDGNYTLMIPQGYVYLLVDPYYSDEQLLSEMIEYQFGWENGKFTGYNKVEVPAYDKADGAAYDLSGRRVDASRGLDKGIYIVGGKKVLVK